jgi:hypothetical protein
MLERDDKLRKHCDVVGGTIRFMRARRKKREANRQLLSLRVVCNTEFIRQQRRECGGGTRQTNSALSICQQALNDNF